MKYYRTLALTLVLFAGNQLLAGDLVLNGKEAWDNLSCVFSTIEVLHLKSGQENYNLKMYNESARISLKLGKNLKEWDDKDLEKIKDFLEKEYLEKEKNRQSDYSASLDFYKIEGIKKRFSVFKEKFIQLQKLDKEITEKTKKEEQVNYELESIVKALKNSGITLDARNDVNLNILMDSLVKIADNAENYQEIVNNWYTPFVGKNIEKYSDYDFNLLEKYLIAKPPKGVTKENINNFFIKLKANIKSQKDKLNKTVKEKGENEYIEIPEDYKLLEEIYKWGNTYLEYGHCGKPAYEKYSKIAKDKFGKRFEKWSTEDFKVLENYLKKNREKIAKVTGSHNILSESEIDKFIKMFQKGLASAWGLYYTHLENFTGQWSTGEQWSLDEKYMSLDLTAMEPIIAFTGYNDIYGVKVNDFDELVGKATIEFNLTKDPSKKEVWTISFPNSKDEMLVKTNTSSMTYKKLSSEIDTEKTRKGPIETITYEDFELDKKQLIGKKIKMKGYIGKKPSGGYWLLKSDKNPNYFDTIKLYTDDLDREVRKWLLHNCENNNMPLITLTALVYNETELKVLKIDEAK